MERQDAVGIAEMSHIIRLRGFWQVVEEGERTTYSRGFGKPRLPDDTEHIWLLCTSLPAQAEVRLNGDLVTTTVAAGPFGADITARLLGRNSVSISLPRGESPSEVALEIRPAS